MSWNMGLLFCWGEKLTVAVSFVFMVLTVWQLFVQISAYSLTLRDSRILIWLLCLSSELFTIVYYAFLFDNTRAEVYFIKEFYRFGVFFAMSLYYIKKANNLLTNKKLAKRIIEACYFAVSVTFLVLGAFQIEETQKKMNEYPTYWVDTSFLCLR